MSSTAVTGEASSAPQEMKLSVQGMTCAAGAGSEKVNTIDGVAATVNFATGPPLSPPLWKCRCSSSSTQWRRPDRAEILDRARRDAWRRAA